MKLGEKARYLLPIHDIVLTLSFFQFSCFAQSHNSDARYDSERIGDIMFSDISVQLGSVIIYVPLIVLSHFTWCWALKCMTIVFQQLHQEWNIPHTADKELSNGLIV